MTRNESTRDESERRTDRNVLLGMGAVLLLGAGLVAGSVQYSTAPQQAFSDAYIDHGGCLADSAFNIHNRADIVSLKVDDHDAVAIVPEHALTQNPRILNFDVVRDGLLNIHARLHPSDNETEAFLSDHC